MGMSLEDAKQVANEVAVSPTQGEGFEGFWSEQGKRMQRSGWELNKMLANTPDFVNRVAVAAFNRSPAGQAAKYAGQIAEKFGLADTADKWKMVAKDLQPEKVNDYIEQQKETLTKQIAQLNPKHEWWLRTYQQLKKITN